MPRRRRLKNLAPAYHVHPHGWKPFDPYRFAMQCTLIEAALLCAGIALIAMVLR